MTDAYTTHGRLTIPLACFNCIQIKLTSNKAIWARSTKCHSPPYPYQYESKILLLNSLTHMWTVTRDSSLLHGGLD